MSRNNAQRVPVLDRWVEASRRIRKREESDLEHINRRMIVVMTSLWALALSTVEGDARLFPVASNSSGEGQPRDADWMHGGCTCIFDNWGVERSEDAWGQPGFRPGSSAD